MSARGIGERTGAWVTLNTASASRSWRAEAPREVGPRSAAARAAGGPARSASPGWPATSSGSTCRVAASTRSSSPGSAVSGQAPQQTAQHGLVTPQPAPERGGVEHDPHGQPPFPLLAEPLTEPLADVGPCRPVEPSAGRCVAGLVGPAPSAGRRRAAARCVAAMP